MPRIAVALALLAAQTVTPLPTIEVKAPDDVASVEHLNDVMGALSKTVTACVTGGGTPEHCRCTDPADLAQLRASYSRLMKQRPEWKDQLLSYRYVNKEGRNISGTLVMQNLRRQLETLKCP